MPYPNRSRAASALPSDSAVALPDPVLRRLPRYLIDAEKLRARGEEWVSSLDLARALGLTSSTVRQDLSHLDLEGVSKRGYRIGELIEAINRELGGDRIHQVVIAGAGFMGSAIALHGDLKRYGFEVCAILDVNPEIVGTSVGSLPIRPISALAQVAASHDIDIGIIAVPAGEAQQVADAMIQVGITALLNLALTQLKVPEDVHVMDERIVTGLQELAYTLRRGAPKHGFTPM